MTKPTKYSGEQCHAAMCIIEAFLEYESILDYPCMHAQRDDQGICELRYSVITRAGMIDVFYEQLQEQGYENSLDFEFVPAFLRKADSLLWLDSWNDKDQYKLILETILKESLQ